MFPNGFQYSVANIALIPSITIDTAKLISPVVIYRAIFPIITCPTKYGINIPNTASNINIKTSSIQIAQKITAKKNHIPSKVLNMSHNPYKIKL